MATLAELVVKISGDTASLTAALGRAEASAGSTSDKMGKVLKVGALAAAAGIGAAAYALKGFVEDAMEAQKIQTQTNAVLESTKGVSGMTAQSVEALANSLSKVIPVDDELIQQTENMLLTFTQVGKDIFPQATEAALNMATALGGDPVDAAMKLGKALNDPVAGVTALRKVGVMLTDQQKDQIKAMVEAGDVAGAQAVILKELETEFGNSGRAAGQTAAGQFAIFGTQIGNIKEQIGGALIPVLTKLAGYMINDVIPAVQKFADEWGPKLRGAFDESKKAVEELIAEWGPKLQAAFTQAKDAAQPFIDALEGPLKNALAFITDHKEMVVGAFAAIGVVIAAVLVPATVAWAVAMIAATWPILAVVAAGALLGLAIKALIDNWDEIKAKTLDVWTSISDFLNEKFGFLKGIFEAYFTYYYNIAMFVFAEIKNYIETTINVIRDIIVVVMALLKGDWSGAWEGMKQLVTDVWEGIKGAIMPAVDLIRNQLQLLWDVTEGLRGFLADKFAPAWTGLSWVFGVVQGILGDLRDAFQWVIDKVFALKDAVEDALGPLGDLINKAGDLLGKAGDIGGGLKKGLGFASGGVTPYSGLFSVGERGRELIALPGGSRVYSNTESRQMVSQSNSRSQAFYGPVTVQISGGGADLLAELERQLR